MKKYGNGALKKLAQEMDDRFEVMDERFVRLDKTISSMQKDISGMKNDIRSLRKGTKDIFKCIEVIDQDLRRHRQDKYAHHNLPS